MSTGTNADRFGSSYWSKVPVNHNQINGIEPKFGNGPADGSKNCAASCSWVLRAVHRFLAFFIIIPSLFARDVVVLPSSVPRSQNSEGGKPSAVQKNGSTSTHESQRTLLSQDIAHSEANPDSKTCNENNSIGNSVNFRHDQLNVQDFPESVSDEDLRAIVITT